MRIVRGVLATLALTVAAAAMACGGSSAPPAGGAGGTGTATPAPGAAAPSGGPKQQPYANLAQIMRALPFPSSNIIFDTQSHDPGAKKEAKEGGAGAGASATFANIYTGWPLVEHSALALAETANLIMIPGRKCQNGKPVPLDQPDFQKAAQGLVDAGLAAYKAAQSKNQEQMVEVSNTVAEACAACHEVYRDTPTDADRCTPKAKQQRCRLLTLDSEWTNQHVASLLRVGGCAAEQHRAP